MLSALLARISDQRTDVPEKPSTCSLCQGKELGIVCTSENQLGETIPEKGTSDCQRWLQQDAPWSGSGHLWKAIVSGWATGFPDLLLRICTHEG